MTKCLSWRQPSMVIESSTFIETPTLGNYQLKLKSDSLDHMMETIPCQNLNCYFKKFPGYLCVEVYVFGVILVSIFPHSDWIRRDTVYWIRKCVLPQKIGEKFWWVTVMFQFSFPIKIHEKNFQITQKTVNLPIDSSILFTFFQLVFFLMFLFFLIFKFYVLFANKSIIPWFFNVQYKAAVKNIRYFARSKISSSLVHKKSFSLIWQVVFKLGYFFCQER